MGAPNSIRPTKEAEDILTQLKADNPDISDHALRRALMTAGARVLKEAPERLPEFLARRMTGGEP